MHPDGKAHGGSAILIKDKIEHWATNSYCSEQIQATSIIITDNVGHLKITALYIPPKHNLKETDYSAFFKTLGHRFIAAGDYNAKHIKWGSRLITSKGRELLKSIELLQLGITSSGEPTYWPTDMNKKPDLVDFVVTKGIPGPKLRCYSCYDLSSDHSPVVVLLCCKATRQTKNCKLHTRKTNWSLFKELVENSLDCKIPLTTDEEVTQAVETFNNCIQQAAWDATPETVDQAQDLYLYPKYILDLLKKKRQARKKWQTTKYPPDKAKFNKLASELKQALTNNKNHGINKYLQNLDATQATDYSLWKATAKLKRPILHQSPLKKDDGSWIRSDKDKSAAFAKHLSEVFTAHDCLSPSTEVTVSSLLKIPHQLDPPIKKFTNTEVRAAIKTLKISKAPGYDLITAKILRELPNKGITFLTQLYNSVLWRNFIPPQWKVAEIILFPKPGKDPTDVKSYRPISLLPMVSKALEKLFKKRLMVILTQINLIPEHQFGFRQGHGTIEQVHRLVEQINKAFENKQYISAVFLDISQAFDKVWHNGLLYKIHRNLPINYFKFIKSYLEDRHFYVKYGNSVTNLQKIKAGVPQGSVLGPLLYLIYTFDLPSTENVNIGTYADDTAILASDTTATGASLKLQASLNNISKWLKDWRMRANEMKSVHVTFTLKRDTCPVVELNQIKIPQLDSVKYLGIHLERRLTWTKHIFMKRKALGLQMRKMHWLLNRNSKLSLENKILLYKAALKPIWTYGLQLWGTASNSNLEILQRFQSKTLRMITNAPWYITNDRLHRELNIKTIKEEITYSIHSYHKRVHSHSNRLARGLMRDEPGTTFRRLRRRAPQDMGPT